MKLIRLPQLMLMIGMLVLASITVTGSLAQDPSVYQYLPIITKPDPPSWVGPVGGTIMSITADPQSPQTMYAATYGGGVFKSLNEGNTWYPINSGFENLYITAVAVNPSDSSVLLAAAYKNKLYRSADSGQSWTPVMTGLQSSITIYDIVFDPVQSYRVFITSRGISNNGTAPWAGVIYRSEDGGFTWNAILKNVGGSDHQDFAYAMDVNPTQSWKVYVAFHQMGPHMSSSSGALDSWRGIGSDMNNCGRVIGIDPGSGTPGDLYYGVWPDSFCEPETGLFVTSTDGPPWERIPAMEYIQQKSMDFDIFDTSRIYMGTFNQGLMVSNDNGNSWYHTTLSFTGIYSIFASRITEDLAFAGTADMGMYRSLDGGQNWVESQQGLHATHATGIVIHEGTNAWYAGSFGGGVDVSYDNGQTWQSFSSGLGDVFINHLLAAPDNPNILYALTSSHGLYRTDLANSDPWMPYGTGLLTGMLSDPIYGPDHPFASFEEREAELGTWHSLNEARTAGVNTLSAPLMVMAFAPTDANFVYIGTGVNGVQRSEDGGATWVPAGLAGMNVTNLAVHPWNKEAIFAGRPDSPNLYVSFNKGIGWNPTVIPGSSIYSIAADLLGNVYVGSDQGLYRLTGTFNQPVLVGFSGASVTAIGVDPKNSAHLYVGSSWGTYESLNGGQSWTYVTSETNGLVVKNILFDPRADKEVAFLLTTTFGIYRLPY